MSKIGTIQKSIELKEAFGSFAILDDVHPFDHPQIYHFARIVCNYLKLQRINEKRK